MELQYKLAKMSDDVGECWLEIANDDVDVRRISNYSGFVEWVHEEWQCVEV